MSERNQTNFDPLEHHAADCTCIQCIDHPSHAKSGQHVFPDRLYVVTMLSNPLRYRSRLWNYHAFEAMVKQSSSILYTVEVAFGERHFELTDPNNPHHLQLRTYDEIWHKENALNLLIQRLPRDAKYIAWVDADVQFTRTDWAQETLHRLQHYDFLQMFSHAQDLGPDGEPINCGVEGFVYKWEINPPPPMNDGNDCNGGILDYYPYYPYGGVPRSKFGHPGYAWAAKKSALNKVGMLLDWALLGAADWHMAMALMGQVERTLQPGYSESYKRLTRIWQDRAERHIRQNVGHVPGTIYHNFHGHKANRLYMSRHKIIVDTKYDPELNLKRDWQGLYQLESGIELRDGLRKYNRARKEDVTV